MGVEAGLTSEPAFRNSSQSLATREHFERDADLLNTRMWWWPTAPQSEIANASKGKLFIVAICPSFTEYKITLHSSVAPLSSSFPLVDISLKKNKTRKKSFECFTNTLT